MTDEFEDVGACKTVVFLPTQSELCLHFPVPAPSCPQAGPSPAYLRTLIYNPFTGLPSCTFHSVSHWCGLLSLLGTTPHLFQTILVIFLFKIAFYSLCFYSCLSFSPFAPLHPAPPTPSGNPLTIFHVHRSCM